MKRSTDRILTTHVGSLIRPPEVREFLRAINRGEVIDETAQTRVLRDAVSQVVKQQVETGIDIVSDGEFGKTISWSQYILERLGGFERRRLELLGVRHDRRSEYPDQNHDGSRCDFLFHKPAEKPAW